MNKSLKKLEFPEGSILGVNEENIDNENTGAFFQNYKELESVTFNGDVMLSGGSFQYCDNLKNVSFNGASTILNQGAFSYNNSLEEITFNYPINIIGGNFRFCPKLKDVVFNSNCEVSGESFAGEETNPNIALTNLVFNGNSTIKGDAFINCTGLSKLEFNGTSMIQDNAFMCQNEFNNSKLKEATLANGLKIQSPHCFENYIALEIIRFNDTAQTEESAGFINCLKLNDIYYNAVEPTGFADLSFTNLSAKNLKIHVPCISIEKYKNSLKQDSGDEIMSIAVTGTDLHNINFVDNVVPEHQPGTEFYHDHDYHWNICKLCNEITSKAEHNIPLKWQTNENYHWQECSDCKYVVDKENHTFENHVCLICFYDERVEPISEDIIPAIEILSNNAPEALQNIISTFDGKTWAIIGICFVLLVGNIVLIIRKIVKSIK